VSVCVCVKVRVRVCRKNLNTLTHTCILKHTLTHTHTSCTWYPLAMLILAARGCLSPLLRVLPLANMSLPVLSRGVGAGTLDVGWEASCV
jgi:hypothetical protein